MLADSLNECHKSSVSAGRPLSLRVFISGRNRLENDGAIALASAFKVTFFYHFFFHFNFGINDGPFRITLYRLYF